VHARLAPAALDDGGDTEALLSGGRPGKALAALAERGREPRCQRRTSLSPVVQYHGLARRLLLPPVLLMRPQLNGGTSGGRP
jgi:hypothetical protein